MRALVRGFSLIEVMVTVLLLCLGLLGVFGLQSRTTRLELEAYQRSQALTLAREMESTIRASRVDALQRFAVQPHETLGLEPGTLGEEAEVDDQFDPLVRPRFGDLGSHPEPTRAPGRTPATTDGERFELVGDSVGERDRFPRGVPHRHVEGQGLGV